MTYQRNETPEPLASTIPPPPCPNCGIHQNHWIGPTSVTKGFWTCPSLYKNGRRIDPGAGVIKSVSDILGDL